MAPVITSLCLRTAQGKDSLCAKYTQYTKYTVHAHYAQCTHRYKEKKEEETTL